ncbi:hypothetical protein [Streptomyces canus]|uniref:hypothetical protein n=1 Tax=Streptomyces canus TaxID=58343 RepID=UPI00382F7BF8
MDAPAMTCWQLTSQPGELTALNNTLAACLACPDLTRACDLARAFADLVRHQRGYLLLRWIRQAQQNALKPMEGFAGPPRPQRCRRRPHPPVGSRRH